MSTIEERVKKIIGEQLGVQRPPGVSEHLQAVVRPPEFYLFVPLESFFPSLEDKRV